MDWICKIKSACYTFASDIGFYSHIVKVFLKDMSIDLGFEYKYVSCFENEDIFSDVAPFLNIDYGLLISKVNDWFYYPDIASREYSEIKGYDKLTGSEIRKLLKNDLNSLGLGINFSVTKNDKYFDEGCDVFIKSISKDLVSTRGDDVFLSDPVYDLIDKCCDEYKGVLNRIFIYKQLVGYNRKCDIF